MASGFQLNKKGVRELLKSAEMQKIVEEHADEILKRLDTGYETYSHVAGSRVTASVRTKTYEAIKDNNKNNSLLKAVH